MLACTGFPPPEGATSGTLIDRAARYAEALAPLDPDVVSFCESPGPALADAIGEMLGMRTAHFESPEQWPGALLTRLDLLEVANCPLPPSAAASGRPCDLFTRHWGRALMRLPGGGTLALHSAHLHPRDAARREREVTLLLEALALDLDAGHDVLLQGDLNHRPEEPEYPRWRGAGLLDSFAAGGAGDGHSFRSDRPMARIDYVWVAGRLGDRLAGSRVLAGAPFSPDPAGEQPALSDHLPLLAEFD